MVSVMLLAKLLKKEPILEEVDVGVEPDVVEVELIRL